MCVKPWDGLLKRIKEYQNALPENTEIWYRGKADAGYALLPSLLRYKNGEEKRYLTLIEDCRKSCIIQIKMNGNIY